MILIVDNYDSFVFNVARYFDAGFESYAVRKLLRMGAKVSKVKGKS